MLLTGEEVLFQIGEIEKQHYFAAIYLKYMGIDKTGVRFKGRLPVYWRIEHEEMSGPSLFHNYYLFTVNQIDYGRNTIWLSEIAFEFRKHPVLFDEIDFNQTRPKIAGFFA